MLQWDKVHRVKSLISCSIPRVTDLLGYVCDTHCSSSSGHGTPSGHRPQGAESKGHQQSLNLDQTDQTIRIPEAQAGAENFISRKYHFPLPSNLAENTAPRGRKAILQNGARALWEQRIRGGKAWFVSIYLWVRESRKPRGKKRRTQRVF